MDAGDGWDGDFGLMGRLVVGVGRFDTAMDLTPMDRMDGMGWRVLD